MGAVGKAFGAAVVYAVDVVVVREAPLRCDGVPFVVITLVVEWFPTLDMVILRAV